MDYAPVRYIHLFDYARETLELRKKRNRKRTLAGDFVWTDEADLVFAWGLIIWHSEPSVRSGTKRSFFLESFLNDRGIKKTRKQIASRLQVLKGEWHASPYEKFLKHPNETMESPTASPTPPYCPDERLAASTSRTHSQTPATELDDTGRPPQSNVSNGVPKIPSISPVMATSNSTLFPTMSYPQPQRFDSPAASSYLPPGTDHNSVSCGPMDTPQQYSDASLQQSTPRSASHVFLRQPSVGSRRGASVSEQSFDYSYCDAPHFASFRYQEYFQRSFSPASSGKSCFGTASPGNLESAPQDLTFNRETSLSYPPPRGLVGIAQDYSSISQMPRVDLNEPQVAMNRRQVPSPSHGINGALVPPIEVPSLPVMTPTVGYGRNSFHRPGGESTGRPSSDEFYPSTYCRTY